MLSADKLKEDNPVKCITVKLNVFFLRLKSTAPYFSTIKTTNKKTLPNQKCQGLKFWRY